MYALMFKNFIRSRSVVFTTFLILAIGIVSIFIGKQFLDKQEKAIAEVTRFQEEHIQRNVNYFDSEMGLLLYYLRFALINKPDKLAALSIGQRDVNPSIEAVTIRGLEAQKYDTDFNNPVNLLLGNLDLGFVIIYLFPLILIVFIYHIFSEEKEGGTLQLVMIQSPSALKFLFNKLSIRLVILYACLTLLFVTSVVVLNLPLNETFFSFVLLSALYLAFWFALSFWIVSFNKSSSFNVLSLLSIWVVLAILLPATVNSYISNKYLVPEALSLIVKQRDGFHEKWDTDKQETINKFYSHYPEFRKYPLPDKTFSWLLYYAMQQMGDDESISAREAMREKLELREKSSQMVASIVPTMHTQLYFNDITQSSLANHLQFLDSTSTFHEHLRLYFYPRIFTNASVKEEKWDKFKPEYFVANKQTNWIEMVAPLLMITSIFSLLAYINFKKIS